MDPIKRISGAAKIRAHPGDVLVRNIDVQLSPTPSQEWSHEFTTGPGPVLHGVVVKGDTVTVPIDAKSATEKSAIDALLSEIDRRIDWANRRIGLTP